MPFEGGGSINSAPLLETRSSFASSFAVQSAGVTAQRRPRRHLYALAFFIALALIAGLGFMVGGATVLGDAWTDINGTSIVSLYPSNVAGIVVFFFGLIVSSASTGLAFVYTGISRKSLGAPVATFLCALLTIGCFLAAYVGSEKMVPDSDDFFNVGSGPYYDQLQFFLGTLLIVSYTLLGIGGVFQTAKMAARQWCSLSHFRYKIGSRETEDNRYSAKQKTARPHEMSISWKSIAFLFIVMGCTMFFTALLPAHWNSANGIASYWQTQQTVQAWVANNINTFWTFSAPSVVLLPGGTAWNGIIFPKLHTDVTVYFAFMSVLVTGSLLGSALPPVRRLLHIRVRVPLTKGQRWADFNPWHNGATIGELLITAAFFGLYCWWAWWWSTGFSLVKTQDAEDPHLGAQVAARTLGHMTTLTMSFLLFPVTKNNVWESVFGIPFERALAYHKLLGRLCWAFVTCHMLTWQAKWLAEGNLGANVIAVANLIVSPSPNGDGLHADNFTIPIAESGWLVLTVSLLIANFYRRKNYQIFQYTHYAVWFFFLAALIHAWSHWYYVCGGMFLYATDKLIRMVRSARYVTLLHIDHAAGLTRLEIDASAFNKNRHFAGQYAFVNIPAISITEWHPFSISSAPDTKSEGDMVVYFHIKALGPGSWTQRLADLALTTPHPSDIVMSVDGPYGDPGRYYERETVLLVAGGIGITPIHSIIDDLYRRAVDPETYGSTGNVKSVHLVWSFRNRKMPQVFANTIDEILKRNPNNMFHIHLHCTALDPLEKGAADPVMLGFSERESAAAVDMLVQHGRPNLTAVMDQLTMDCSSRRRVTGKTVFDLVSTYVCGPAAMTDAVADLSMSYGFHLHVEPYSF